MLWVALKREEVTIDSREESLPSSCLSSSITATRSSVSFTFFRFLDGFASSSDATTASSSSTGLFFFFFDSFSTTTKQSETQIATARRPPSHSVAVASVSSGVSSLTTFDFFTFFDFFFSVKRCDTEEESAVRTLRLRSSSRFSFFFEFPLMVKAISRTNKVRIEHYN